MAIGIIGKILLGALFYEGAVATKETIERHSYYNQARQYSDSVGKPLLVVGMKRFPWQPPNGDITVDIDPEVEFLKGGIRADICDLPFPDSYFGAVFCPHVPEHLYTAEDVQTAVYECTRVADEAYFLCPSPYSIYATLMAPSHHQRIWFNQAINQITVKYIDPPFAFGGHSHGQYENQISQAFVARRGSPMVVELK